MAQILRVQKYTYWLVTAQRDRLKPAQVVDAAMRPVGMTGKTTELTKAAMLRSVEIATELGCLDKEGMAEMNASPTDNPKLQQPGA